MANNFTNTRKVAMKALDSYENELEVLSGFNTDWAAEFNKGEQKIGDYLLVRWPYRWQVVDGAALQKQPMDDQFSQIRVDRHKQIGWDVTKWDEALNVDDLYKRCFETQILQMANEGDDDACKFAYQNTNMIQGTLGTYPASLTDAQSQMLFAMAKLKAMGCHKMDDIRAVLSPWQSANSQAYTNQQFNSQAILAAQYRTGKLQDAFGFNRILTDQNIRSHQSGTFVGTPQIASGNSAADGATSLVTSGWTAGDTLFTGDVIGVAGTQPVNPVNRRVPSIPTANNGLLLPLVITQDFVAVGAGGNDTIYVSVGGSAYSLRGPGQYQNCDALPAAGSLITVWPGTTSPSGKAGVQGLAFGPDAFAYVPIAFRDPSKDGAWGATVRDPKTGMSLTLSKQYQIGQFGTDARIDMGYGLAPLWTMTDSVRLVGA